MGRHRTGTPILRGVKMMTFLLGVLIATVLTSGLLYRPTQADFLHSVGCWLNINCSANEGAATDTTGNASNPSNSVTPGNSGDSTGAGNTGSGNSSGSNSGDTSSNPDQSSTEDTTAPTVALSTDRTLAGGTVAAINITGSVQDGDLASYSLTIKSLTDTSKEPVTVEQGSNFADPKASIGINEAWNVVSPSEVPTGKYLIMLDAKDASGNPSHQEIAVQVDNTPPVLTIKGGGLIQSGSIRPDVTATDTDGNGVAGYAWVADKDNPSVLTFNKAAMEPTFTPDTEGTYVFTLSVPDGLGNVAIKAFSFDYAPTLAIIPLPTLDDPTKKLADKAGVSTALADDETYSQVGSDDSGASDKDAGVLGNTVTTPGQLPLVTSSTVLTPTGSGWSIFGILWYWWVVVMGIIFATWLAVKKVSMVRVPEHS